MSCSWQGGPGRSSSHDELDLRRSLLQGTSAGVMSQLMAVETGDPQGLIGGPWLLVVGAGAVQTWGDWARCCWRGPGSDKRCKTSRGWCTRPGPLRGSLMSSMLYRLPLMELCKLAARLFYQHDFVYQMLKIRIVVANDLNFQVRVESSLKTLLTCIISGDVL